MNGKDRAPKHVSCLSPQRHQVAGFHARKAHRHSARVTLVASRMAELVSHLPGINDQAFWNGCEQEIIAAFRADLRAREAANPPPYPKGL